MTPMPSPTSMLRSLYRTVRRRGRPTPAPLEKVYFLHVPKCGGTSIDAAFQRAYRAAGYATAHLDSHASERAAGIAGEWVEPYRKRILLYHMAERGTHYISGHFNYSRRAQRAFGDEWHHVTILREPVSRWLSHYFYNRYQSEEYRITAPLEEFVESRRGRRYGLSYVWSLVDGISMSEADSEEAVEQAIRNLDHFAVVGVLERLDVFAADCEHSFGVRLAIGHRRKNPRAAAERREELSAEVMEQVRALCAPNRRIYEAVRARIDERDSWLTH